MSRNWRFPASTSKCAVFRVAVVGSIVCALGCGQILGFRDLEDTNPSSDGGRAAGQTIYRDWPRVNSAIRKNPEDEAWIAEAVKGMKLNQKIGQMTQPEANDVTYLQVKEYYIGSVVSGGNDFPKYTTPGEWLAEADNYFEASTNTDIKVPILYAVDAVHGNQKQFGSTLFPHNIGLGAANDPDLMRRIGEATAHQMRVSGFNYTLGPCVAVPQDDRWGRTYEGFSESPVLVSSLSAAMTKGFMNIDPSGSSFQGVITTAKHFVGDGSTSRGIDQGVSTINEQTLINLHGLGYFALLEAGAQTVMVSYSSWKGTDGLQEESSIHGSDYLLTTVLKGKMGFDGFIISNYNGIGQISGCTVTRCAKAINAGIDVFMVAGSDTTVAPTEPNWHKFIRETIELVEGGEIPMARIDDAVTRILRVKRRAGLFKMPKPSMRVNAKEDKLDQTSDAREAVRKSLVLLKNNRKDDGSRVLPLSRASRVLLVGKSGDSKRNQVGGYSLTWQNDPKFGKSANDVDFPGQSILQAVKSVVGEGNVTFSETAHDVTVTEHDAVIAAIGETPYAQFVGDIIWNPLYNWGPTLGEVPEGYAAKQTLEHAVRNPEDLAVLAKVSGQGVPVITIFLSGRPLYTTKELNLSDAFVAAWLPGTEADGITDVLFRSWRDDRENFDFQGKLSFSWPASACQTSLNVGQANYAPLFKYGFGLTYQNPGDDLGLLEQTPGPATGCPN